MTVRERPLEASSVTLAADATGRCVARLGPMAMWERWHVTIIGVSNTSSVKAPECRIYQGSESPSNLINGTYDGKRDADPAANVWLETGQQMIAVWSNGDAGSIGTLAVKGVVENGVQ